MRWRPHHEPLSVTLRRTIGIAVVVGGVLAWRFHRLPAWPIVSLLVLWFSFGGHWIEIWFLNWLRPRIPAARGVQIVARLAVWFIGGIDLGVGIALTMRLLTLALRPPTWWRAGIAFIAVELAAHAVLALRGCRNFYRGDG